MTDRFWAATVLGTYAGHGETFMTNGWSGVGGILIGKSPPRLAFYRQIMQTSPPEGIEPLAAGSLSATSRPSSSNQSPGSPLPGDSPQKVAHDQSITQDFEPAIGGKPGEFYFVYFGRHTPPKTYALKLPAKDLAPGTQMHVDVIDTWNMTTTPIDQIFTMTTQTDDYLVADNNAIIPIPNQPGMLLRVMKIQSK
jgi:hypothetical protein